MSDTIRNTGGSNITRTTKSGSSPSRLHEILANYYEPKGCTCSELDSGGDCPYCQLLYLSQEEMADFVKNRELSYIEQLDDICAEAASFCEIDELKQATDSLGRIMEMSS